MSIKVGTSFGMRLVLERRRATGMPESTIPAIEYERVRPGVERARTLARASEVGDG